MLFMILMPVAFRSVLQGSGFPRYFHSMVLLGSLLVAFGGSTHTDVTKSTGSLCYSDDIMAYDFGMSMYGLSIMGRNSLAL